MKEESQLKYFPEQVAWWTHLWRIALAVQKGPVHCGCHRSYIDGLSSTGNTAKHKPSLHSLHFKFMPDFPPWLPPVMDCGLWPAGSPFLPSVALIKVFVPAERCLSQQKGNSAGRERLTEKWPSQKHTATQHLTWTRVSHSLLSLTCMSPLCEGKPPSSDSGEGKVTRPGWVDRLENTLKEDVKPPHRLRGAWNENRVTHSLPCSPKDKH